MAALSSSSTTAEVYAAYDDNASYAEDNSASKARAFETACRILLRRDPLQAGRGSTAVSIDKQSIREELSLVRQWLAARSASAGSSGTSTRRLSFNDFRS